MQKLIIVALALVAVVAAAPPAAPAASVEKEPTKIVSQYFEQQPDGSYKTGFETDDGTKKEEVGELKEVPGEDGKPTIALIVRGQYSYIDNEGHEEAISYGGDENGFHAEGSSIPKNE